MNSYCHTRHPVHYALLFDDLYDRRCDAVETYYWELTSDDVAAAVSCAVNRIATANEDDLCAAVQFLDILKCRELIRMGVVPGERTHFRLIKWYEYAQVGHAQRRQVVRRASHCVRRRQRQRQAAAAVLTGGQGEPPVNLDAHAVAGLRTAIDHSGPYSLV